ncbi:MAG: ABC transporter substrate-binding protein [Deltaproteobacteria bacterium]|nr:ABC transporter substrate-binding protein [Deltaproteobacteria bacterium]
MDFEQFGQFTVKSLHDGRKEITDGIGRKLLLVPRGNKPLKGDEEARTVRVPVEKVVVYSAYNAALIKELGRVNSIAGVISPEERWYIPEIREGIRDGKISYIGEYKSIDYEKLKALKPNVVFTWDEGIIPKLEELSIPCVLTSTRIAKDLASHINFIQFLSAFYGEEEMAKSFVDAQFKEIDEISAGWKEAKSKPKVVWGDIYERKVLVEPGNSWAGQMVEKAGGDYLFHDLEGASCMQVTLEKFFSRTKGADILVTYRGPESGITSKERLRQSSRLLQAVEINPMNEGSIYFTGCRLYQTADVAGIIGELASLLHPGLFPEQKTPEYFFKLQDK